MLIRAQTREVAKRGGTSVDDAGHSDGTVGKALAVLDSVAAFDRPVRFSEVLAANPYPRATLYRLLRTLTHQGMLSFDADAQTYTPGLRLVRLAHAAWQRMSLAPVAREHVDTLWEQVGETVHLGQLDTGQVLYVDKRHARMPVEMFAQAGKVGPAYCTGIGKAMLAFQDEPTRERLIAQQSFHAFQPNTLTTPEALRAQLDVIRAQGHAHDDEEHERGIVCIALPVLSRSGRVLGGLSVTSTRTRHDPDSLRALLPQLETAARRIADAAETWRFPENQPAVPATNEEKRDAPCQD